MFEKYLIADKGFRNVVKGQETIGYEFKIRIPYYRGIPLSCLETIDIQVDGEVIPHEDMIITVDTGSFEYHELETVINDRWEMNRPLTVFVKKTGGLSDGEHLIKAFVSIRISYQPHNNTGENEKRLVLEEPLIVS